MTGYDLDDLGRDWDNEDNEKIFEQRDTPELRDYRQRLARMDAAHMAVKPVKPCSCACNYAGWCGGCGHAGCGGR